MKQWMTLPFVAAMIGCSGGMSTEVEGALFTASRGVSDVPGAVADLSGSVLLEEVADKGPYPGFDTNLYPGDDAMRAWRDHAGYHWVGYYLLAPCHKDGSWQGKRDMLESMGWGLAAIFLDIEHMTRVPNAMRDYYVAWTERILEDGRFRPAYYAHTHNAQQIYDDVRAVFDRRGIEAEPPFWIAEGKDFERDRHPIDVGNSFAAVWQGVLDTWEHHGEVRLPIDVNVAAVPSPSSAEFAD